MGKEKKSSKWSGRPHAIGHCSVHDRLLYAGRKIARRVIRMKYPGDNTMSPYECSHGLGWHVGHLPNVVVEGKIMRRFVTKTEYRHE